MYVQMSRSLLHVGSIICSVLACTAVVLIRLFEQWTLWLRFCVILFRLTNEFVVLHVFDKNDDGEDYYDNVGNYRTQWTAEGSVFGVVSLWFFCLCMKYFGNRWIDLHQIHTEDMFGPSLERVWRSKIKVTRDKNGIFQPFQRFAVIAFYFQLCVLLFHIYCS